MRIALISDIHGNLVALDAVLEDMARQGPFDQIVVAGDLAWAGPWPAETVDRVRALDAMVIQGNTDAFFGHKPEDTPPDKRAGRFADHLRWMQAQLGPERVDYLANLPFAHRIVPERGHALLVVHANPWDYDRPIMPAMAEADLDELLMAEHGEPDWAALAFGHIHVPFCRRWRGRLLVDVASAGLPMDGDPRAVYAIMTWDGIAWHADHQRVFYDAPIVAHRMRNGGLPRGKHFAERLMGARYNGSLPMSIAMMK